MGSCSHPPLTFAFSHSGPERACRLRCCLIFLCTHSTERVTALDVLQGAGGGGMNEADLMFPDKGANDITCVGLSHSLLVLGTKRGTLQYWHMDNRCAHLGSQNTKRRRPKLFLLYTELV